MQWFGESDYKQMNELEENPLKISDLEFHPRNVLAYYADNENEKIRLGLDYTDDNLRVCAKSLRDFARIESLYNRISKAHKKVDESFWKSLKKIRAQAKKEYPAAQELFLLSKKHSGFYYTVELKDHPRGVTYGIDTARNLREDIANQSFRVDFCHYTNDDVEDLFQKEILSRKLSLRSATFRRLLEASLFSRIINWYTTVFLVDKKYNSFRNTLNISVTINGRDYSIHKPNDSPKFRLFVGKNHMVFKQ